MERLSPAKPIAAAIWLPLIAVSQLAIEWFAMSDVAPVLGLAINLGHVADMGNLSNDHFAPDTVAKVENRTTLKISRKLIFRLLWCCLAIQRRYEGPGSILGESIWSLTLPRVKRISGSKKFRSSPQKDFFNSIRPEADATQSQL